MVYGINKMMTYFIQFASLKSMPFRTIHFSACCYYTLNLYAMKRRRLTLVGALVICAVVIVIKELIDLPEYKDPELTGWNG